MALEDHSLATLFIRNRHLLWLSIVVVAVAGVSALLALPRLEDPRMVNRFPLVITQSPGYSAQRVEALVTEPVERVLREVPEIREFVSTSSDGLSLVAVVLHDWVGEGQNEQVFSKMRDRLAEVQRELPAEASRPQLEDQRGAVAETLIVALTWREGEPAMGVLRRQAEVLADRLRAVPGTELVRLAGEPSEQITVVVDDEALALAGLTPGALAQRLIDADVKQPAGIARSGRSDIQLEVTGELDSVQRVRNVAVRDGEAGSVLRVGDVADVRRTWRDPPETIALANGERAVLVAARMGSDQQTDRWARAARAAVERFRVEVGDGVGVDIRFDQSTYTAERLGQLGWNLLAGAGVVMLVILVLMGARFSLLVGAALPMSAGLTLFGLLVLGGTLQQMSMFGMIIATGLLIDNAIVMTDEVRKRLEAGMAARAAVRETVEYLFFPLLSSTLTTMLAFAPIALLPGPAGDFVSPIAIAVMLALASSFLLAFTVIPALAALLGAKAAARADKRWWRDGVRSDWLTDRYRAGLQHAFATPAIGIGLACLLPVAGFALMPSMGTAFFPPVDRDMFHVRFWLSDDASLERTAEVAQRMEAVMRDDAGVADVDWMIGGGYPPVFYNVIYGYDGARHFGQAIVTSRSDADTARLVPALQAALNDHFPEAQVVVDAFGQGPPSEAEVELRIHGPSIAVLQTLGDQLRLMLQSHAEVVHTQVSLPRGRPKLWLDADEDEAMLAGLTLDDLARQLEGSLEGIAAGSVIEQIEQMPVYVRYDDAHRREMSRLSSMRFLHPQGEGWVPLSALGELRLRPELPTVTRYNGQRFNSVQGYTRAGALSIDVANDVRKMLDASDFTLPDGYWLELGGDAEQQDQAVGNLMQYAPVLIAMAITTLVLTFRSVLLALLLITVAMLSVGLSVGVTWVWGLSFSFNTMLGAMGLIGVAFNNSIVVLNAIRKHPQAHAGDVDAVAERVVDCSRHLISTTLTTIGGFVPLLIFVGGAFWPSLAIVLAGGVGGSMILAILFTPAVYVLARRVRGVWVEPTPTPVATGGAT
ncbi:efflux RND transporter permease subunit [Phycisphaerales bacterium AB-hyl4]|uniref:Efflux RND transporter permease subunit n=1 Tax=Natronomicrosphaera hydrolytica TaxID=3242702 RepID=A0ABV4U4C1_9BACT